MSYGTEFIVAVGYQTSDLISYKDGEVYIAGKQVEDEDYEACIQKLGLESFRHNYDCKPSKYVGLQLFQTYAPHGIADFEEEFSLSRIKEVEEEILKKLSSSMGKIYKKPRLITIANYH